MDDIEEFKAACLKKAREKKEDEKVSKRKDIIVVLDVAIVIIIVLLSQLVENSGMAISFLACIGILIFLAAYFLPAGKIDPQKINEEYEKIFAEEAESLPSRISAIQEEIEELIRLRDNKLGLLTKIKQSKKSKDGN